MMIQDMFKDSERGSPGHGPTRRPLWAAHLPPSWAHADSPFLQTLGRSCAAHQHRPMPCAPRTRSQDLQGTGSQQVPLGCAPSLACAQAPPSFSQALSRSGAAHQHRARALRASHKIQIPSTASWLPECLLHVRTFRWWHGTRRLIARGSRGITRSQAKTTSSGYGHALRDLGGKAYGVRTTNRWSRRLG